jgi:hypothetical protein
VSLMGIAALLITLIAATLVIAISLLRKGNLQEGMRPIPAFDRLRKALGLAVEDGSRVHVSLGSARLLSPQSASSFVGLEMLDRIALMSSNSDRPPVATSGDPALAILSQDTLKSAFHSANVLDQYDAGSGRLTGFTPFSYAAGTMSTMVDENVSANVLIGHFGPEVALLTDSAERENHFILAASDGLTAQSILYAAAQEPLIGEELFAGGAYLQAGPVHSASLRTQDILRFIIAGGILLASILKLAGVL